MLPSAELRGFKKKAKVMAREQSIDPFSGPTYPDAFYRSRGCGAWVWWWGAGLAVNGMGWGGGGGSSTILRALECPWGVQ